jgi:antitoxin component YwqK of YwqJK toxin-antitoxin module
MIDKKILLILIIAFSNITFAQKYKNLPENYYLNFIEPFKPITVSNDSIVKLKKGFYKSFNNDFTGSSLSFFEVDTNNQIIGDIKIIDNNDSIVAITQNNKLVELNHYTDDQLKYQLRINHTDSTTTDTQTRHGEKEIRKIFYTKKNYKKRITTSYYKGNYTVYNEIDKSSSEYNLKGELLYYKDNNEEKKYYPNGNLKVLKTKQMTKQFDKNQSLESVSYQKDNVLYNEYYKNNFLFKKDYKKNGIEYEKNYEEGKLFSKTLTKSISTLEDEHSQYDSKGKLIKKWITKVPQPPSSFSVGF